MSPETVQRRRVIYSGRVQGVGFRYTARRIAQGYAVTGFVRNVDDGTVELVAEGAPAEIERMLGAVVEVMGDNIRSVQSTTSPATGQFFGFEIAY